MNWTGNDKIFLRIKLDKIFPRIKLERESNGQTDRWTDAFRQTLQSKEVLRLRLERRELNKKTTARKNETTTKITTQEKEIKDEGVTLVTRSVKDVLR